MAQGRLTNTTYDKNWPAALKRAKKSSSLPDDQADKPIIIDMEQQQAADDLVELVNSNPITRINDNYDEQLAELVISRNPQVYQANLEVKRASVKDYVKEHYGQTDPWRKGSWAYYPWSGVLVHVLEKELFWEARTIRNRDLITASEQKLFRKIRVGCAGMSVGSSVPLALALQGGAENLKLVDSAVISASNLNRILAGVDDIGRVKSLVIARKLYEMNPYMNIHRLKDSLNPKELSSYFDKPWPLDVVVDEVDNLEIKIRLRVEARKRRLPVLMATELGDDVMLDIERFDLNPNLPLFHGIAGPIEEVIERRTLTQREWLKYATTIINTKNVPLRMQQSLLKIGQQIVTHPQLGSTAMAAGAVVAFGVRRLSLDQPLPSGRFIMSMDANFVKDSRGFGYRRQHGKHTKLVQKTLDSM